MTSRGRSLVTVLAVTLLVVTAAPVQVVGQAELDVASRHTDFGTGSEPEPTRLSNVSITGSGDTASVVLNRTNEIVLDDAEDGDINEYGGDTGFWSVESTDPINGSYSVRHNSDTNWHNIYDTNITVEQGDTLAAEFEFDGSAGAGDHAAGVAFGVQSETSGGGFTQTDGYLLTVLPNGDGTHTLYLYRWSGGTQTTLASTGSISLSKSTTYSFEVEWYANGTINGALVDGTGTVATLSATDTTYTSGGIGWVGQGTSSNAATLYDDYRITGVAPNNGSYLSATHSASARAAWSNLTLQNATANVSVLADPDGDGSYTVANQTTYQTGGNRTLAVDGVDADSWRVRVNFSAKPGKTKAELHDEGLLFESRDPTASINDTISPADGEKLTQQVVTLGVDVSDADVATAQGDELTVRWYRDGEMVHSDTVTSNGTVRYNMTFQTAGDHTWRADVIDSYGNGDTTTVRTLKTPGNLRVRNVSDTSQLVTSGSAELIAGDRVVTRQIGNDGNVSLTGLPTDEPITISTTVDGYRDRTIVLDSVYQQSSIYLLPETEPSVIVRFELDDVTGVFPQDTTQLRIKRPVNESGNTSFVTVSTDTFGVEGVTVELERGQRYRLEVVNGQNRAGLGKYVAEVNETVVLQPAAPGIEPADGGGLAYDVSRRDDGTLVFQWVDTANQTDRLQFTLINNETGATVFESQEKFDLGEFVTQYRPPNGTLTDPHVLRIDYTRDGDSDTIRIPIGPEQQNIVPPGVPPVWLQMGAGLLVLFVGGLFSQESAGIGALVTAVFGAVLWWVGILSGVATAATVTIAVGIGVFAAFGGDRV